MGIQDRDYFAEDQKRREAMRSVACRPLRAGFDWIGVLTVLVVFVAGMAFAAWMFRAGWVH